ncbi:MULTISPECIES: type IX secretion system membrane protein PorP/SprF [unclassified Dysgonomonas]|uniref:PorP/SprF family type IX secretion system membrane protein n=1 Tax=unclassified Dysgonomonas TaxID=2630389 RepID=UPI0013EC65B0|nr:MULTISPECIES: type IX secretion system membrane protein PorP/SprF [unclassified Dysgonomonas]
MKIRLLVLLIIFLSVGVNSIYGQWDAQVSQYWKIKNYYNPSFIGETESIENVLLHRRQWVGMPKAPNTSMASFNMPFEFFGKKHGFGFLVVNEDIGLFSNTTTALQYAYKFKFKKNRSLNVGIQGALANINFDAGQIRIPESDYHDPADPAIPGGGSDKTIDASLGVSWVTPNYYIGFSASHLWEPAFDLDENHSSYMGRAFYLMGGYNIKLRNPLIEFQPSAFIKSDAVVTQVDVTAKIEYNKMFNGGISWRKDDGVVFLLGVRIRNIDAGYSYDLTTSDISTVSNGSHELFLRYIIPLEKKKPMGAQKSVRIL